MAAKKTKKRPITTAILLAAGCGKKIWPYGDTQPKAALPVANRSVIDWQLQFLSEAGIESFIVVTGHLGGEIRAAVGGGGDVTFVDQGKPTGTADACLRGLAATDAENVLVVWGDTLWTPEDLGALLNRFAADPAHPALLAAPVGATSPQDWLCPKIEDGTVTAVFGHPREGEYRHAGLLATPRSFGNTVARVPEHMSALEVGVMPIAEREVLEAINIQAREGGTTNAVIAEGLCFDLDKPWQLLEANDLWLHDQARRLTKDSIHSTATVPKGLEREGYIVANENAVVGSDVKLKGTVWIGAGAQVTDGAILCGVASIGAGAKVHQYCQVGSGTSIGKNCVVGHCAEFAGLLMEGAYSYHYGEYWGVLGRHADLGAATVCGTLRFDDQETAHRIRGRRETPQYGANASYLGDYVRTGVNTILMPGVKVGSCSVIGAGVILNEDAANGSLIHLKQELIKRSWGPERYGW